MDYSISKVPKLVEELEAKCKSIGFKMPSDRYIGSLLRTLVLSKTNGRFLELGTGIGLSLAWIVDGLTPNSTVISIDNDPELVEIANDFFSPNNNVDIVCMDGSRWLDSYSGDPFDLIFADAWPGKYQDLDRALELLKVGGFYIIDDMEEVENWPPGHAEKAENLVRLLDAREDLKVSKLNWSTGVIIATKIRV